MPPFISPGLKRSCHALLLACAWLITPWAAQADTYRHTVQTGDTLWQIADRYLEKPWRWSQIWQNNPQIHNPHLIYPGDLLLISPSKIRVLRQTKLPVEKRHPKIRVQNKNRAIPTLSPQDIATFTGLSMLIPAGQLDQSAYVLQGVNGELILGKYQQFYAKNLAQTAVGQHYQVVGAGRLVKDPSTQAVLAQEAIHLGYAELKKMQGDIATLGILSADQEIRPGNFLVPDSGQLRAIHYLPRPAPSTLEAQIAMIPRGVDEAGQRDNVILNAGQQQGLQAGDVLHILKQSPTITDPQTGEKVQLPPKEIATAMVYRSFDNSSYALLLHTEAAVSVGDWAVSPDRP